MESVPGSTGSQPLLPATSGSGKLPCKFLSMNLEAPSTLLELASRSLLRDEALDPCSLQDLPMDFFLPIFQEAVKGGHTHVLRPMVQAWPFPSLPLGSLMKTPCLKTLQAILDGLDTLLNMKDRPREWKLQVLNLQNRDENLWKMGCGYIARACSELPSEVQTGSLHSGVQTRPFKIFVDLCITIKCGPLNDFQDYLLDWVKVRRQAIQLCCKRLQILSESLFKILQLVHVVHLDSIEELQVDSLFHQSTMKTFAVYLGMMSNLQKFSFDGISPKIYTCVQQNRLYSCMYAPHLRKLDNLREIYIDDVFFLQGQLHNILRSHTPLVTLSLKSSPLTESDLQHLSECPSMGQLKHLALNNIDMRNFSPQPLRALLERVAGTLETLVLNLCEINDSHICHILPALGCCSHLSTLNFYGNYMSLCVLHTLLAHTVKLSQLRQVLYPVPSSFLDGKWLEFNEQSFLDVSFSLRKVVMDLKLKHEVRLSPRFWIGFSLRYYSLESNGPWKVKYEFPDHDTLFLISPSMFPLLSI